MSILGMMLLVAFVFFFIGTVVYFLLSSKATEEEDTDTITDIGNSLERIGEEVFSLREQVKTKQEIINSVYSERDQCVSALTKLAFQLGWDVGLGTDETAEPGWKHVVYVDLPTGQVSWHIPDKEVSWFSSLPVYTKKWDGHDTVEKYRRLALLGSAERPN